MGREKARAAISARSMEEEQQLSFFLEWYDPQSDQLKPYVLHYHGDNTVEMVRVCMPLLYACPLFATTVPN